jgi:translation initiation factor 1
MSNKTTEILNLQTTDPFADVEDSGGTTGGNISKVHIRIQQRTTRKRITSVQGLDKDLDLKRILKALKKEHNCNGTVLKSEEYGEVLKMSGDQRQNVRNFLVENEIVSKENIILHGV